MPFARRFIGVFFFFLFFCFCFSDRCLSRSHWLTAYGDLFLHIERLQRTVRCQIPTEGFLQAEPINSLCYLFMKSDCYVHSFLAFFSFLFFFFFFFFSFLASDIYAGIVWGIHRVGKEHSLCLRLLRVLPQSQRHGLSSFIQCPRTPPFCIPRTHSFRPSLSGITYTPSLHHRPHFPQYSFRFILNWFSFTIYTFWLTGKHNLAQRFRPVSCAQTCPWRIPSSRHVCCACECFCLVVIAGGYSICHV